MPPPSLLSLRSVVSGGQVMVTKNRHHLACHTAVALLLALVVLLQEAHSARPRLNRRLQDSHGGGSHSSPEDTPGDLAKAFYREMKKRVGFHEYAPAPAFMELSAEEREAHFDGFRPFYTDVVKRMREMTHTRIEQLIMGDDVLRPSFLELHELAANGQSHSVEHNTRLDSLLETTTARLANVLRASTTEDNIRQLKQERDQKCASFMDASKKHLDLRRLEDPKMVSNEEMQEKAEACQAVEAAYQSAIDVRKHCQLERHLMMVD